MEEKQEDRQRYLLEKAIPESLTLLAGRAGAIEKAAQNLESAFQSTDGLKQKAEIERRAYHYVADALSTIAKDIEIVGGNVAQLLEIESRAVVSLEQEAVSINTMLHFIKENTNMETLVDYRIPPRDKVARHPTTTSSTSPSQIPKSDESALISMSILERLNNKSG